MGTTQRPTAPLSTSTTPSSRPELAELHFHLGQSAEPHTLWSIAHEQGIKLPQRDYWRFHDFVTVTEGEHVSWEDYHKLYHWTERIQSSPTAMERVVYEALSGAYRVNNLTLLEPSFNPMFRNLNGERDLDLIMLGALRGMERVLIEYPNVRAGILITLDRRLSPEENNILVTKAIKYRSRGIVGIDLAGPRGDSFSYDDMVPIFQRAKEGGLKTTIHTGEDGDADEMAHILSKIPLDRIHHGFACVTSPKLMEEVARRKLTLCICPSSSIRMGFMHGVEHLREIIHAFLTHDIRFTINTDSPAMLRTNILRELAILRDNHILTEEQITQTIQWAFDARFIPTTREQNMYL